MEWLKNNPLVVITDPDYWDCNCYENYIHKKSVTLSCPVCKMTEDENNHLFLTGTCGDRNTQILMGRHARGERLDKPTFFV